MSEIDTTIPANFESMEYSFFVIEETFLVDIGEAIADVSEGQVELIDKEY